MTMTALRPWQVIILKLKKKMLEYRVLRMRDRLDGLLRGRSAPAGEAAAGLLARLERAIVRLAEAEKAVREEKQSGNVRHKQDGGCPG